MKKLLLLALVVIGGVMQASATVKVYMKPGTNWSNDNAIFKLYFFQSSNESNNNWTDFTNVVGQDGYYVAEVDNSTYDKMIFVRMNPGDTDKSYWDRRWNQSWNLDIPTNNSIYYVYNDASGAASTGEGFNYTSEELNYKIFYGTDKEVVKDGEVTIVDDMDATEDPYIFTYTFDNTASGSYYFMLLSVSNIGEGNSVSEWNKVFFAEGTGVDNPQLLTFSNGQTGAIVNKSWTRWKIDNVPAIFVITFNRIAATWSVTPYFTRTLSDQYATFSSDYDVAIPSGLKAYYASAKDGNNVTMTKYENGIASTDGAFLKGTAGSYTFTPATTTDVTGTNYLKPGTSAFTGGENCYVFAKQGSDYGFYNYNNSAIDMTGKAYLDLSGAGSRLNIVFADEASAISSVATEISASKVYHDLQGRRVAQPTKGMYIVNGKKMIIK